MAACTVDKSWIEHLRNYSFCDLSLTFYGYLRKLLCAVHSVREKGGIRSMYALARGRILPTQLVYSAHWAVAISALLLNVP